MYTSPNDNTILGWYLPEYMSGSPPVSMKHRVTIFVVYSLVHLLAMWIELFEPVESFSYDPALFVIPTSWGCPQ